MVWDSPAQRTLQLAFSVSNYMNRHSVINTRVTQERGDQSPAETRSKVAVSSAVEKGVATASYLPVASENSTRAVLLR